MSSLSCARTLPDDFNADLLDEVSALVLDFGSNTTRAGYAGEDTPRVVCPSYFGYTDQPSGSTNGNSTEGGANGDGMDVDSAPPAETAGSKSKRKYFVGEDGVGVWRPNMEVGNFTTDGIGTFHRRLGRHATCLCLI